MLAHFTGVSSQCSAFQQTCRQLPYLPTFVKSKFKTMKVIIAEKPSVAREIAKVFGATTQKDGYMEGKGFTFTWAFGHLPQLAPP